MEFVAAGILLFIWSVAFKNGRACNPHSRGGRLGTAIGITLVIITTILIIAHAI